MSKSEKVVESPNLIRTVSYRLQKYGCAPQPLVHEIGPPEGQEILLEVEYAGVCHSDVHIMDGYQDLGDGERIDFSQTSMPMPLTMGHEIVGRVCAVGPAADPTLLGHRRLVYPWIGCRQCVSCRAGLENHCETPSSLGIFTHGGYARHVRVPSGRYLIDIGDLDPGWASTLACSGLTVFSAIKQLLPMKPSSAISITGAGGLGLMAVAVAKALSIERVIVCDVSDDRLDAARALGANHVINTANVDGVQSLRAAAQGALYGVIDTVGLPSTIKLAVDSVMKGSRIILVGLQGGRIPLPLPTLPFKALSLVGTYTGSLLELEQLIDIARSGGLRPMPIWQRDMHCLGDSLDRLRRREVLGRIVLRP